jgi:hypothetical protein
VTYLRLLDADAEGAEWNEVARIVAACQGLSQNEIGCARISMMARSTNAPSKGRIQMRKATPPFVHIRLATHGRFVQKRENRKSQIYLRPNAPIRAT